MKFSMNNLALAMNAVLLLGLAGCGGGDGGSAEVAAPAPAPAPAAAPAAPAVVNLTGTVMVDGAIKNAVVCMDLNANGLCDTGEPASAPTGTDGAYSLSYDTATVAGAQAAATSLIARMVPGPITDPATTIDAGSPADASTDKPYVMRQVPGKAGQINPLTTLVSKGVADGMLEADARANVALQLAIAETKIDNYQDDPLINDTAVLDMARQIAVDGVATALSEGATLNAANQTAEIAAAAGDLAELRYVDSGNYSYRAFTRVAKPAGTAGSQTRETRAGKTAGVATGEDALFNYAFLATGGWTRCNTVLLQGTVGTPARSTYCGALEQMGFTVPASIEGRAMSSVVTELQADAASNTINAFGVSTDNLFAALGTTTFPAGSSLNKRHNLTLKPAIQISSLTTDARSQTEATSLEQLIASKPAAAVNLANGSSTLTLGLGSTTAKSLRVAFTGSTTPTSGAVQYYECDFNGTALSNCVVQQAGTYSIVTVSGSRVLRFAGQPATVASPTNRVYAEVQNALGLTGNWVYQAREGKSDYDSSYTVSNRLNATAWAALKAQLGL